MLPFVLVVMLPNPLLSIAVNMTGLCNKGAEDDSKAVTSLMRCAVPQYLTRTSRAGLVTVTKFSHQSSWWLPMKSSHKADWRLSQEVRAGSPSARHNPSTTLSTAGQRLQCSTQANGWRLHGWKPQLEVLTAVFPQPSSIDRSLIQGYTAVPYQSRPLTQGPKPVGRGRGGLQRKMVYDWAGQLEPFGVFRALTLPASVTDSWGHERWGRKGWETALGSDPPVMWPLMHTL